MSFWLCLLSTPRALQAQESLELIDLLPPQTSRALVEKKLTEALKRPVTLTPPSPSLIEALRWAIDDIEMTSCQKTFERYSDSRSQSKDAPTPDSPDALFPALLARAEVQMTDLDLEAALQTLREARTALPCRTGLVSVEDVRRLFLYEGIIYFTMNDERYKEAFLDMLAVAPQLIDDPDLSPKIRRAVVNVALDLHKRAMVPIDPGDLDGIPFIDGRPVEDSSHFRVGQHVLQLRGPLGELRSKMILIDRTSGSFDLSSSPAFVLPHPGVVQDALTQTVLTAQIDAFQKKGLTRFLSSLDRDTLLFVVSRTSRSPPRIHVFDRRTGLIVTEPDVVARYLESAPHNSGLSPDAPSHEDRSISVCLRVGGATVIENGGRTHGTVVELSLDRRVFSRWLLGFFANLHQDILEDQGPYPCVDVGVSGAYRLALSDRIHLTPSVGYAGGKGPPVRLNCSQEFSGGGTNPTLLCAEVGSSGPPTAVPVHVASLAHGPLARIEIGYQHSGGSGAWGAGIGVLAHALLFTELNDGQATFNGTEYTFTVDTGPRRVTPLRFDVLLGFNLTF